MKNTKKRMEIFNQLSFELYHVLKLKISDIHLSEFCMCITAVKYMNRKDNGKYVFRLYSINLFENYYEIRCLSSYLNSKSKKYRLIKKF